MSQNKEIAELYVLALEVTRRAKILLDRSNISVVSGTAGVETQEHRDEDREERIKEFAPQCGCGRNFVLRYRKRDGAPFYGCAGYPGCTETMSPKNYDTAYGQWKNPAPKTYTEEEREEFYRNWRLQNGHATQEDLDYESNKSAAVVEQQQAPKQDTGSLSSMFRAAGLGS